jgi:hypothetical protein
MGPHMKVNTLHSETIGFNVHPQKKTRYLIDLVLQEARAGFVPRHRGHIWGCCGGGLNR